MLEKKIKLTEYEEVIQKHFLDSLSLIRKNNAFENVLCKYACA